MRPSASHASTACAAARAPMPTCPAGIGTGALRLAPFDDPTSFLRALDDAEIVRRPRSMLRLQVEKRRRQRARPS